MSYKNQNNYGYRNDYKSQGSYSQDYRNYKERNIKADVATVMTAIVLGILLFVFVSKLNARGGYYDVEALDPNYDVEFIYHEVEVGDSISYIAEKYIGEYPGTFEEYQSLICSENGLKNRHYIVVGDTIKVPIYTVEEDVKENNNK